MKDGVEEDEDHDHEEPLMLLHNGDDGFQETIMSPVIGMRNWLVGTTIEPSKMDAK